MEKIWLNSYPDGVPCTINLDRYPSLTAMLQDSCYRYGHKVAFQNFGTQLTYQELLERSLALAAYFQKQLNLAKGDRLAIMMPNILQYPVAIFAALHLGLIIVNINPLYTERELLLQLQDCTPKAIILLANFAQAIDKIVSKTTIKHFIVTELGDEFSAIKGFAVNSYLKYVKQAVPFNLKKMIRYKEALQEGSQETFEIVTIEPQDIAFLQYTGGTTGVPKGAMLTHQNIVANVLQCLAWIASTLEKGQEIVVAALPLYHIFSLTICLFAFWEYGGLSLLITNPRNLKALIKELERTPFTVFVGVNTLYHALLHQPAFHKLAFTSLKLALAGGMPIMNSVADKWQALTKKPIVMGYGLTEASPVVTINPLTSLNFSGSIGLPIPSTDIAIVDEEGKELSIGMEGELCVKGPQVMLGYWHQPKESKNVLNEFGWLRTGDIASINEQGFIYLIDRKKDMILVSGFNVYPNEVEEVIASHPGVAEVAVVGIPHAQYGERVMALIVKKDPSLNKEDIAELCKQKLTGYKRPKIIKFCQQFPKSNVGKILKTELRALALKYYSEKEQ